MYRRFLIVLAVPVAIVVGLLIVQNASLSRSITVGVERPTVQLTGIVKALRAASLFSNSAAKRATVTLADGSQIEATVSPNCPVRPGEAVHILVFGDDSSGRWYYIVGPSATR